MVIELRGLSIAETVLSNISVWYSDGYVIVFRLAQEFFLSMPVRFKQCNKSSTNLLNMKHKVLQILMHVSFMYNDMSWKFVICLCSLRVLVWSHHIVLWNLEFWQQCFGGFESCGRWHNVTAQNTQIFLCLPITEYLSAVYWGCSHY